MPQSPSERTHSCLFFGTKLTVSSFSVLKGLCSYQGITKEVMEPGLGLILSLFNFLSQSLGHSEAQEGVGYQAHNEELLIGKNPHVFLMGII
jgi:hypothetical protein